MGGIEKHVCDISEALVEQGWKVTALVCADDHSFADEMNHGVRVIRMPRLMTILSQPITWGYVRTLLQLDADLVHCHVPFPLGWLAVRRLPKHIPVVCTWHSDIVRQRFLMPFLHRLEQQFLRRCNKIVVTSPEYLQSSNPLNNHQERCEVIPLTLPPNQTISETEIQTKLKKLQILFPQKTVLYVGRLVGYKGLLYLVQAMRNVDAQLIIAGDGPLRTKLTTLVEIAGLQHKIHFLGFIDEPTKLALYRLANVFVLPSIQRSEAFGYVLLEAMSQGCPVISTDMPTGVRWVNQHEQTGLVVPPKDANSLAEAINRMLHNDSLREQCSKNAMQRAQNDFQFDDWLEKLESIYCGLLT